MMKRFDIIFALLFGIVLGFAIALPLDYFRNVEQKAISSMHFKDFVRYRDKADSLQRKLDSCMDYEAHTHRMINEIKSTGKIHSQGSCKMMVK